MLKQCKRCFTMKNIKGKKEICKRCEDELDSQETKSKLHCVKYNSDKSPDKKSSLSDKINGQWKDYDGNINGCINVSDVKEFIKQLKRALDNEKGLSIGWTIDIKEIIDKLAGDKLNGN